jgi:hypothetical protein
VPGLQNQTEQSRQTTPGVAEATRPANAATTMQAAIRRGSGGLIGGPTMLHRFNLRIGIDP